MSDDLDPAVSGALPTQADGPVGRRHREDTAPGAPRGEGRPSLSAFDPPPERFETRGELGRGGMGWVEGAYDRALGRQVAIKHVLSDAPVDLARFEREARITARLEHPGIVPVHDAGRTRAGTPFYVMRHVDGRPLDDLVADRGLAERLALVPDVLAVCDAVGYAHARGVVHRDIKPSNILVGPFGETLLIDWGLAREIGATDADAGAVSSGDAQLTRVGAVAGTPGFMAPEQARGESVDARADVFALGATLFHVLAGQPPYGARSATEMIDAVGADRPPEWRRIPREVPADLLAILHKAMASDAAARYPDAGAMAADLRRFVAGQLVAAHAYGVRARLLRFARRHRGALAVGAIALVVVIAVVVFAFLSVMDQRDVAERERGEADAQRQIAEQQRRATAELRDDLLIDSAKRLAVTDPLAAIATLQQLPPDSTRWPLAAGAAAEAFYRGVPSGFELDGTAISWIDVAPDSVHAIVTTGAGTLFEIDLVARTKRRVARFPQAMCSYVRRGAAALCHGLGAQLMLVDLATGATTALAIAATSSALFTDGAERAWVLANHVAYPVQLGPTPAVGAALADHVDDAAYIPGPDRFIVVAGGRVEVFGATERWQLSVPARDSLFVSRGTTVGFTRTDASAEVWDLAAAPKLVSQTPLGADDYLVGLVGDHAYFSDRTGQIRSERGLRQRIALARMMVIYRPYDDALVVGRQDGSIIVYDADGAFELGPRPAQLGRVALSPDHRYVLASTATGLLEWWDLSQVRPHRGVYEAPNADDTGHPVAIGAALWTLGGIATLTRYDLASHAARAVELGYASNLQLSADERYLYASQDQRLVIRDLTSGAVISRGGGEDDGWVSVDGGVVVGHQRALSFRRAPDFRAEPLAELPEDGGRLVGHGPMLLVITGRSGCRMRMGGRLACVPLPAHGTPEEAQIEVGGRAWLSTSEGLFRWDVDGAAWEPVTLTQRITGLVQAGGGVLGYNSTAIVVLGAAPRVYSVPAVTSLSASDRLVVYSGVGHTATAMWLDTGVTFALPVGADLSGDVVTDGRRVAAFTTAITGHIGLIDLSVPTEGPALRAWLATVTNARATSGGVAGFP